MAGIFDPKFIKDGNVTANLSFLATIKLPSLTSESSSLDFLSIAADNSIKKRSLGTMALLSATNFYDKITADSTFLKLTGGTLTGGLQVNSNIRLGFTNYLYTTANDFQTVIQTSRSDSTQYGYLSSNGWGDFLFSKGLAVGYTGISTTLSYKLDVNGTARFTGNVTFGDYTIFGNNKFIDWNDSLGNARRLLGLASNGFHVGDVDNVIANSVTNLWANIQHNFFVNNDLKIQLTNGWNYFKGHIQAYGVANAQLRSQSSDTIPIVGKIQSVDGNSVYMGSESNHYLNFITNNINRATIDTNGNFGIGTNPIFKLTVQTIASASPTIALNINNPFGYGVGAGTSAVGIRFNRSPNDSGSTGVMADIYGGNENESSSTQGYLAFGTRYGASESTLERIRISSSGYLGIGTTNPQTKLHIGGGYGQLNGLAIGSLSANEYGTVLFTENYGNGVTHLFSLKNTIGYGDIALAEYGGRVGIGTDRPNVKLDVRGTIRIGNNGFVTGSAGSFMDIWHTNSTGNSQVNLQAWSNGGNTYDSIVLQPLSGEVRIGMPTDSYYKLNVGGTAKIDGFLRLGENLAFNNNQFAFWRDSAGTDRRIIGMNAAHSIYLGDIDRTISNSNLILLANSTHWFYVGQANMAVITSSGLDVKGNYYQNGVLKTFFSGNYNDLVNRPDLSAYLTQANVVTDNANVTVNNLSPISSKLVYLYINDLWGAVNSKAAATHTHDYYSLTNRPTLFSGSYTDLSNKPVLFDGNYNNLSYRPDLSAYLTQANVVTDNANVNVNNLSPIASKLVYLYINDLWGAVNSKAAATHTHDYYSLTNRPTLFSGSYTDLSNKPVLFDGNYNNLSNKPTLFDGNYNSLINKPTLFDGNYNSLINKPTLFDGNYNSLINKPTLFDGNYYSLSNRPDLGIYLYGSVNASNRLEIMRTISFTSDIEMAALSTPQLVVTSILNCQGQLTVNADMNVMNPKTLTNSQINTTSIVGVYVDFGNKLTRLTLAQFKNLMATV